MISDGKESFAKLSVLPHAEKLKTRATVIKIVSGFLYIRVMLQLCDVQDNIMSQIETSPVTHNESNRNVPGDLFLLKALPEVSESFSLLVLLGHIGSLVVELFTSGKTYLNLNSSVLEIDFKGH